MMRHPNRENLTGQKFGCLTVIGEPVVRNRHTYYRVRCDCGEVRDVQQYPLTHSSWRFCGAHGCSERQRVAADPRFGIPRTLATPTEPHGNDDAIEAGALSDQKANTLDGDIASIAKSLKEYGRMLNASATVSFSDGFIAALEPVVRRIVREELSSLLLDMSASVEAKQ